MIIYHIKKTASGVALTEFLIFATMIPAVIYGINLIGEYGLLRIQTVSAARLAAWQRTAWVPAHIMDADDLNGVSGATSKDDTEVRRDIVRHIFLDRSHNAADLHAQSNSEFNTTPMTTASGITVTVATSISEKSKILDYKGELAKFQGKVNAKLGSNDFTHSLEKFAFWDNSYLKNEVSVSPSLLPIEFVKDKITMVEQVTMLTEPWNAGGSSREQIKIQGLVPTKLMDSKFSQAMRAPFETAAAGIKYLVPDFNGDLLSFGFTPGSANETSPLDRFEQEKDSTGKLKPGYFRPYRAFPPTPIPGRVL